ncbi:hypothetical protein MW344_003802 [Vibrio parahaemolyticus]|uniref:Uncharacterized protein n=1 Tax=Vibrio parahaemolyticus TaxID=670 RepID=A0A9Q3UGM4_VIBPH|nr:hypothetical protein [Vibrio parahaemolyticus]EGQ8101970.1 hypothetical protein [Vibrio parahaemolyticus]EGQ8548754.1 hypothetical protein [Vibrio parahaemolyticus]EGQ9073852.1 hypothetical protein [Vibrio parahaemolyticus]EGQ9129675.1 hypothetical protein [Vibrio parahaemolyticus]EGQ9286434.1 hypothetical protein [Vibrio parahaemolyticus]
MTDITIHLSEHLVVPTTDHSLLELVRQGNFLWPRGATCATQDGDGAIVWWNAAINKVKDARKKAKPHKGLYSLLGIRHEVGQEFYYEGEQEVVASDWKTAVVTLEQFTGLES